jgi:biopolymer transport protein ExbB
MTIRRGTDRELRTLVERALEGELEAHEGIVVRAVRRGARVARLPVDDIRPYLDDSFQDLRDEMGKFSTLVTGIVSAAPLAGLLGTVTGMIETFASLQEMALYTQSGGVAGGISAAVISTQMGLAVAIPGMLAGRILERRRQRLTAELRELGDVFVARRSKRAARETSGPVDERDC